MTGNIKKTLGAPEHQPYSVFTQEQPDYLCPFLRGWDNQYFWTCGGEGKLEMSLSPCLPPLLPSQVPVQKLGESPSLSLCTAHPLLCSLQGIFTPLDPWVSTKHFSPTLTRALQGPFYSPLPLAAARGWSWCCVPAISGTRLGQELSFNEILLKDSVTNSHLSKWTFGAFSPWCQCCGWMFPGSTKPDANIGLFYMTAIKLLKHTRQEASRAFCGYQGLAKGPLQQGRRKQGPRQGFSFPSPPLQGWKTPWGWKNPHSRGSAAKPLHPCSALPWLERFPISVPCLWGPQGSSASSPSWDSPHHPSPCIPTVASSCRNTPNFSKPSGFIVTSSSTNLLFQPAEGPTCPLLTGIPGAARVPWQLPALSKASCLQITPQVHEECQQCLPADPDAKTNSRTGPTHPPAGER